MRVNLRPDSKPQRRYLLAVAFAGLLAAACGTSSNDAQSGGGSSRVGLPSVEVTDIASGKPVALASLLPADRALLIWFWAPH